MQLSMPHILKCECRTSSYRAELEDLQKLTFDCLDVVRELLRHRGLRKPILLHLVRAPSQLALLGPLE
eukprot:COSAG01_NODE_14769_length_1412_cov_11.054075_1_plen_67_part_10